MHYCEAPPSPALAKALGCGYSQAHFIREFTALTGTTPAEYRRRTHAMSVFYNTESPATGIMVE